MNIEIRIVTEEGDSANASRSFAPPQFGDHDKCVQYIFDRIKESGYSLIESLYGWGQIKTMKPRQGDENLPAIPTMEIR